jgi:hypothetical protein
VTTNNEDRKVLASELISNALITGTSSPKLEAALIEFFSRIDEELFWDLHNRDLFIVDGSSGASMAQHCETTNEGVDIIFLSKDHIQMPSQKTLVGVIAHEFGHIMSGHASTPIKVERSLEVEREADELAKSWGFTEEIEAKNMMIWSHQATTPPPP